MKYDQQIVVKWFAEHGLFAEPEYRFASPRKWRFDFYLQHIIAGMPMGSAVALEVEGGVWTGGRHTRGTGFMADIEKYNEAAARGWKVLRCVPNDLCTMETVDLIKRALNA